MQVRIASTPCLKLTEENIDTKEFPKLKAVLQRRVYGYKFCKKVFT